MTRQEFLDNITEWYELIDFCNEYGLDFCQDVLDEDAKDDWYTREMCECWVDEFSWREMLRALESIPDGYDWYIYDENCGEVQPADDADWENIFEDVLDWADDNDVWTQDDEDDEVQGSTEDDPEEDEPFDTETDFTPEELFAYCAGRVQAMDSWCEG